MLRFTTLVVALSCAMAFAQQPASQTTPPAQAPAGQSASMPGMPGNPTPSTPTPDPNKVPMNEPVITLKGACQAKSGAPAPAGCVSSLTREQFEKLTDALQPAERGPVPPDVRRRFATQYAKLLAFADAARQLGLENDPRVKQVFTFAQNQILAESLNQHYREEYAHPTDQQIQDYYNQHQKDYVERTLQRIIIPVNQGNNDKAKPTEEEFKAYVLKIRERWVAGEDPATLEKEAMEHMGVSTAAPDINLGARRPGSLPPAHESVFEMKVNEISQPFSDAPAAYIYKVTSIREVPLSDVKTQISQTVQNQMFKDKMDELQAAVTPVLNDAYFGPEAPPTMQHGIIQPGMPPMPGHAGPPQSHAVPAPGAGAGSAPPPGTPAAGSASTPK
ncbi:MAG TPA: peptidyl-prolyl cis-trans isomerase [Terriglobales bacterium]|nr:peptidyl-prolyl cis-trans isomerase [Terriglobales bacterium]